MLLILATLCLGVNVLLETSGVVLNESRLFSSRLLHLLIFPPFVRAEALSFIHLSTPIISYRLRSHSSIKTLDEDEAGFECCILGAAKELPSCVRSLAPLPLFAGVRANCGYESGRRMKAGRGREYVMPSSCK